MIGLFRLAGIEEDDDLITVCVSDIRSGEKIASTFAYAFSNGIQSSDFTKCAKNIYLPILRGMKMITKIFPHIEKNIK